MLTWEWGIHGNEIFIFAWKLGVNVFLGVEEKLSQSAAKHTTKRQNNIRQSLSFWCNINRSVKDVWPIKLFIVELWQKCLQMTIIIVLCLRANLGTAILESFFLWVILLLKRFSAIKWISTMSDVTFWCYEIKVRLQKLAIMNTDSEKLREFRCKLALLGYWLTVP